jgi:hypothetical protein
VHINQVVSDWQNWCINLSYVNSCFQRGWWVDYYFIVLQSSEMEWHLSRMLNIQDACLPAECTEMWNIFMGCSMKVDVLLSTSWLMS